MNLNQYVPDSLIPILTCFPTYETSIKFSKLFYENYKSLPQHKVLFDEYVEYTNVGYKLGSIEYKEVCGKKIWCKNGNIHRENDKPAFIGAWGTQYWYKNGKLHRENDEPAVIGTDRKEWWINEKRIK